ncbi:MAG: citramalate synthase [Desulfitobacteriaceae bacterium]|nr:citramalate synthase [Desulfitobacteriaceae bacterium]
MTSHNASPDVFLYDTTLRDGSQREGISYSLEDKIRIAERLDRFGVHYIEGGWPGSNPKDARFFERAAKMTWQNAKIAAFGSTTRKDTPPEEDSNLQALLDAQTPVVTLVGKSWDLHVFHVLETTLEENLRMIGSSVAFMKAHGKEVIYDAEHFFDGYKADADYALQTLRAAEQNGADVIVLCDTNGGCLPWEIERIVGEVKAQIRTPLGVHCHNDSGCGVANTLAAVQAGAVHVQGTINGYGERVGNADLCAVTASLQLKMGKRCVSDEQLARLTELSTFVAEVANLPHDRHQPYVGASAFTHKGGIHVAAMLKHEESYQHIDPRLVGNMRRSVVSELSGRGNLVEKAQELGVTLSSEQARRILNEIKELEAKGFTFEGAEGSVNVMLQRAQPDYQPPFELIDFTVVVEHRQGRGMLAEATVKVRVGDRILHTAAEGNGPVNALDAALRKALEDVYPAIRGVRLDDYKVRIVDSENGTASAVRVLIDTKNGTRRWSTVGASTNIIEASWRAIADSFEYALAHPPTITES